MSGLLIGYARVSTEEQDLTAQRNGLVELGVDVERIYVDHGLTGTNRDRPGLREALAACRAGDTLVVTKLDRLARSLPDARAIAEDLTKRKVRLSLGGSVYDPTDPVGRLLFNVLAMVAEFEADLIRSRTREGMRVARAKGHLRGKQPKLNPRQEAHLVELLHSGEYTTAELGDLFGVGRSTVYRAVERSKRPTVSPRPAKPSTSTLTPSASARTHPARSEGQLGATPKEMVYRPRHGAPGLLPSQADRKPKRTRRSRHPQRPFEAAPDQARRKATNAHPAPGDGSACGQPRDGGLETDPCSRDQDVIFRPADRWQSSGYPPEYRPPATPPHVQEG